MTITGADPQLADLVDRALAEDVGTGDVTAEATVDASARAVATITQKAAGVISGLAVAEAVFARLDPRARIARLGPEGEWREPPAPVLRIEGAARALLTAERTAPPAAPPGCSTRARRRPGSACSRSARWRTAAASTTGPGSTTSS